MSIVATDSIHIAASPQAVWNAIVDFSAYPTWWQGIDARVLKEGLLGAELEIQNGKVRWMATVVEVRLYRELHFLYEGSWHGRAKWVLTSQAGGVEVAYHIDIQPRSLGLKLLGMVLPLGKIHSRQMQKALSGLKSHMELKR